MSKQLRSVTPEDDYQASAELDRQINGESFALFKRPWETFPFKEGTFVFRFLTQPIDSKYPYCLTLPYIYADPKRVSAMRGYIPLTAEQAAMLTQARNTLWGHPVFKNAMACRDNPNGVDLKFRYRDAFIGFQRGNPEGNKLYVVALPSNGPLRPSGNVRLQAGTMIRQFFYEKDVDGELKYPGIFNPDTGRLIKIDVAGSKDRTEYRPSVDKVFPIVEGFDEVIDQVPCFEDIVDYEPDNVIMRFMRRSMSKDMFDYLLESHSDWSVDPVILEEPSREAVSEMLPDGDEHEADDEPFGSSGSERQTARQAPTVGQTAQGQAPTQQPAREQRPAQPQETPKQQAPQLAQDGSRSAKLVSQLQSEGIPVPDEFRAATK